MWTSSSDNRRTTSHNCIWNSWDFVALNCSVRISRSAKNKLNLFSSSHSSWKWASICRSSRLLIRFSWRSFLSAFYNSSFWSNPLNVIWTITAFYYENLKCRWSKPNLTLFRISRNCFLNIIESISFSDSNTFGIQSSSIYCLLNSSVLCNSVICFLNKQFSVTLNN